MGGAQAGAIKTGGPGPVGGGPGCAGRAYHIRDRALKTARSATSVQNSSTAAIRAFYRFSSAAPERKQVRTAGKIANSLLRLPGSSRQLASPTCPFHRFIRGTATVTRQDAARPLHAGVCLAAEPRRRSSVARAADAGALTPGVTVMPSAQLRADCCCRSARRRENAAVGAPVRERQPRTRGWAPGA